MAGLGWLLKRLGRWVHLSWEDPNRMLGCKNILKKEDGTEIWPKNTIEVVYMAYGVANKMQWFTSIKIFKMGSSNIMNEKLRIAVYSVYLAK